jgi:hypothetical protein
LVDEPKPKSKVKSKTSYEGETQDPLPGTCLLTTPTRL